MIVAFATDDNRELDAVVSYHFGRCPYYTFVEIEGNRIKRVFTEPNPGAGSHQPGEVPQFLAGKGVSVVFAGGMGPRAQQWFTQLGIQPITGVYGKVRDILNRFMEQLPQQTVPVETEEPPKSPQETRDENDPLHRIEKELAYIREVLAELASRVEKLEKK